MIITQSILNSTPLFIVNVESGERRLEFTTSLPGIEPREGERIESVDYWNDSHPNFPVEDWKHDVANGDTRLGYWEWARNMEESTEL